MYWICFQLHRVAYLEGTSIVADTLHSHARATLNTKTEANPTTPAIEIGSAPETAAQNEEATPFIRDHFYKDGRQREGLLSRFNPLTIGYMGT